MRAAEHFRQDRRGRLARGEVMSRKFDSSWTSPFLPLAPFLDGISSELGAGKIFRTGKRDMARYSVGEIKGV